jgi:hypothetical protein
MHLLVFYFLFPFIHFVNYVYVERMENQKKVASCPGGTPWRKRTRARSISTILADANGRARPLLASDLHRPIGDALRPIKCRPNLRDVEDFAW